MVLSRNEHGRVFISYRRSDSQWAAARLNDTLDDYFGEGRVFRDVGGITAGAKFGDVIQGALGSADAFVVLIGPEWLDCTDDAGARRLEQEGDWVRQELAAALASDVPIYPVLIGDTPMPRTEELPAALQGLTKFNAISISDQRWEEDVTRLARVIALDVPSQSETLLRRVNLVICGALFASIAFVAGSLAYNLAFGDAPFLAAWQAGVGYIPIVGASVLLLVFAKELAPDKRRYARAAGIVGLIGVFTAYVWLVLIESESREIYMGFGVSTVTITAVLCLMSLSGFKPK